MRIFLPKNEHSFEYTFFLRYGIILPKVLQIKIFIFLRKLDYVNLNLVKFQLQSISQLKDIKNRILLPVSSGIFSSYNAPKFKPLFLRFDIHLNYGNIWNISSFSNLIKYYTILTNFMKQYP